MAKNREKRSMEEIKFLVTARREDKEVREKEGGEDGGDRDSEKEDTRNSARAITVERSRRFCLFFFFLLALPIHTPCVPLK